MIERKRRSMLHEGSKLPPQACEIEEAILGALMLHADAYEKASAIITHKCFYKDAHGMIYKAISDLQEKKSKIDILTVTEELRSTGKLDLVGGPFAITQLTNRVASAANIETHSAIIYEKFIAREVIRISGEFQTRAFDEEEDAFDLIDDFYAEVSAVRDMNSDNEIEKPYAISIDERVAEKAKMVKEGVTFSGLPTGNVKLDKTIGGFVKANLIIIAARPAMGKSVKGLNYAKTAAEYGARVALFSLEMSKTELIDRQLVEESKIYLHDYRANQITDYDLQKIIAAGKALRKLPIDIFDTPSISCNFIRKKCKKIIKQHGSLGMIVVDYLQMMTSDGKEGNREQEVSSISRGLKAIAKEFDVPVLALAQVGRSVMLAKDRRPDLSHLRECLATDTSFIYGKNNILTNCNSRIDLLSLNKSNNINVKKSNNIPKEENIVYRVKTTTGRYVDATAEHPILTSSGYIKVKDLQLSDSIAIARNFPFSGELKYINESRFIGWMLGNGSFTGYSSPSFITSCEVIASDFCNYVEGRFGIKPRYKKHWSPKVWQYEMTAPNTTEKLVRTWLKDHDMWNKRSYEKYIPDFFMETANKQSVCELLQGLFETDGSVSQGARASVSYSSTSKILIDQIAYLLAKVGVIAYIDDGFKSSKATTPCYKLKVSCSEMLEVFIENVQLAGYKGAKLKALVLTNKASKYSNKLGYRTCKEIEEFLVKNPIKRGIQTHGGRRASQTTVKRISKSLGSKAFDSKFSLVLSGDLYWDPIESITNMGLKPVFDRSVPGDNNLVVNGIVVHNSGAIEQDADIVAFIYRPSYYFEHGKHPDEEYAPHNISLLDYEQASELLIGKNRNGIPNAKLMEKFYGHYSTFSDKDLFEGAEVFDNSDLEPEFTDPF